MIDKILIEYPATIKNGKVEIYDQKSFKNEINEVSNNGIKNIRILVIEDIEGATNRQKNYYFGILLKHRQLAFEDVGVYKNVKQCDKELRKKYLLKETLNKSKGVIVQVEKSLAFDSDETNKLEMRSFIESCIRDTSENLNYQIPYPKEEEDEVDLNFNR